MAFSPSTATFCKEFYIKFIIQPDCKASPGYGGGKHVTFERTFFNECVLFVI